MTGGWFTHQGGLGRIGLRAGCMILVAVLVVEPVAAQVTSNLDDFLLPGTQPDPTGTNFDTVVLSSECSICHEASTPPPQLVPIQHRWEPSMKANAMRDPLFHACLTVANQDAVGAGDLCLRCHTPGGWLEGRSTPTNGSALIANDFDGVNCNICHRMVDPVFKPGSPAVDEGIISALETLIEGYDLRPASPGSGMYVVDPDDSRRGPLDDVPINFHGVPIITSPFHTTSEVCASCHNVSNPMFKRQPDGSYALDALRTPHETLDQFDMFPLERTYSEWANSAFANGGVDRAVMGVDLGGDHDTGILVTCQDCHMPDVDGAYLSQFYDSPPLFARDNVPAHNFNGGSTWMIEAIHGLYPDAFTAAQRDEAIARARDMLANAAMLEVFDEGCTIRVRVTNNTGHKLPTGYPEGRRMWVTVEFFDDLAQPVVEHGAYNGVTADLVTRDTKVYEAKLGIDNAMSIASGKPAGPSFHFALNNKWFKDNRIPPRGFTNAAFEAVQAAPVAAIYADGQFWDDTIFTVPPGAYGATVRLYYQSVSREYIEFLRDANVTDETGNIAYSEWAFYGKSPPELMGEFLVDSLAPGIAADTDCDGDIDAADHAALYNCVSGPALAPRLGCETLDADLDHDTDLRDLGHYQRNWTASP